ncbi:MAG TPA: hypothetical protein VFD27_17740, partial [Chthoniobacteraceae bacterium]|nr:hypothetical protein [Chthoniobacteraceae bacterium]
VIQGAQFNIGEGGISNHDTQTMSFTAPVSFSGVGFVAIRAINGSLNFTNLVTLPSGSLSIAGGYDTSFGNIIGSSPLFKLGSGTTTWTPSLVTGFDVFVDGGTLRTGADGGADSFNSNASIEVHGLSVFEIGENLTLNGAELTRDNQATISVAAGKILTAQNGGLISITGPFLNASDSTINVLGANSTLTGNMGMSFLGGSTLNVTSGGTVSAGSSIIISGNGTVSVTGNDSSLSGTMLYLGTFETGTLTFSNDASGNFSEIRVDDSNVVGTAGVLNIQSGALVTAGDLFLAPNTAANTGTITITDAGSALNFTAGGTATIGAASGSTATLNVQNEGDFISGTGTTTVNATGTIALTNGDYFSYGNLTINGGQFTKDANSLFGIDSGRTLTVQAGGDISVVGNFALGIGITVNVTGAGSTISLNGLLAVVGGTTMNVLADADVFNTANGGFQVGSGVGNDVVTVDGAGSSLGFGSGGLSVGVNGSTSTLTFSNGSTGTFAGISVDATTTAGTSGLLRIQSGATVTGTSLNLAPNAAGNTGTITITGAGSALTLSGAATAFIGAANKGAGTLNVQNGGTFNSGTGLTTVNATGTIAIAGGTFVANGNVTLNGGQLTRDATGVFNLAASRTLTVQAGGDAIFTGNYTDSTASSIAVTGAGSTLSTTGMLVLTGGSTLAVSAGGSASSGAAQINVATPSGNGAVTVDGAGSTFSGGTLAIAQGGNAGSVTFSNGSTGTFSGLYVDLSAVVETNGTLNIQSGASVTSNVLFVAPNAVANIGTITITGAGSALTLNGAATATIGATSSSIATVNVENGGTFTTGTGLTTVNATGDLNVNTGGTMIVRGDMIVYSSLDIAGGGTVILEASAPAPTEEIGGLVAGTQYDRVNVGGTLFADGTLDVDLLAGYTPHFGDAFDLIDAGNFAGAFDTIALPDL